MMFFGVLALIGIFFLKIYSAVAQLPPAGNPLFPPGMNAAEFAKEKFVIGDLGGVPVRIPHYFANYVEYDGDPGFGEKRQGPIPERNYQSRLNSFGFMVRFPDMAGRSSKELWDDYNKYHDVYWKDYYNTVKSITPWISVGIISGSRYKDKNFLDRHVEFILSYDAEKSGFPNLLYNNYKKLNKSEYDLTVYAPPGINYKNNKPYRQHEYANDLFVHRKMDGKIDTFIKCSNRNMPDLKNTMCTQSLNMEPNMNVAVDVTYTRNMLPHWKIIQKNIVDLILSFKLDETTLNLNIKKYNLSH